MFYYTDSPWGHWGLDTTKQLHFHFSLSCIGEGNGHPVQCSCLENPRDGRAWWAAIYGVAQSRTQLKRLSSSSSQLLNLFGFFSQHCLTCSSLPYSSSKVEISLRVFNRFRLNILARNTPSLILEMSDFTSWEGTWHHIAPLCLVTKPYLTLATTWTVAWQALLSMEICKWKSWSE